MRKKVGIIGSLNCIHLRRFLETIDRSLYDVTIISWEFGSIVSPTEKTFFQGSENFHFLKTIRRLWAYFYFIKQSNFDILHCFGALSPISWLGGIACSSTLTASVIGVDIFLEEQIKVTFPIKASIVNLLRMSDQVFFLSSAMKTKLIDIMRLPEDRLQEDFLPLNQKWRSHPIQEAPSEGDKNYPIIYSPRMLAPLYRQYELIEAIARLKLIYPNILLRQTGYSQDLNYRKRCQYLVKDRGLANNIIFMDPIDKEEDLIALYDQANLVVMIPVSDGMPSSLIEAWWRKKPVVVSDIYNYEDSWNWKFFVKTSVEVTSLSNCIANLLRSEDLRRRLVKSAFTFISGKSLSLSPRFEGIKIKKKLFRKIYGFILFLIFLLEPHFVKLRKSLGNAL